MFCPSCGAEIEADDRFAHLVVCEYCDSAIVMDEEASRISGEMAALSQTPSPFYVGGTGEVLDRQFTILGRVRYGYEMGYWDEWYLAFDDGETAWISEDGEEYTLESWDEEAEVPVDYASVAPGDHLELGETEFHVDEKNAAECEGGEGQLPFPILSGEKVPFLDLSSGEQFATIEFDVEEETSRLYRGRHMDLDEVEMEMTAQEAGVAPAPADTGGEAGRERVVRGEGPSMEIKCFYCGAPLGTPESGAESMDCEYCGSELDLTLRRVTCEGCGATVPLHGGDDARSVVCSFCNSQLDVSGTEPSVLGVITDEDRPQFPFELGDEFTFRESVYELVGHLRYKESYYIWDEFLLHSEQEGYRWLSYENGHFSIGEKINESPSGVDLQNRSFPTSVHLRDHRWKFYESGTAHVTFVDGELPWIAKVEDEVNYGDYISPPYMLSAEWTGSEAEWFEMEYLPPETVAEGFGLDEDEMREPRGVAANQPYPAGPFRRQYPYVLIPFAVLFLVLAGWVTLFGGSNVGKVSATPDQYASEYLTDAFTITEEDTVCQASFHAPVDNSWVYLDCALVNEDEEAVLDFSTEISYYHGRSDGESWSEGSREESVEFKLKEPGEYRFLLLGQAGRGSRAGDVQRDGKKVTITVYEGVILARYFIIGAIVCVLGAALEFFRRHRFEARRQGD